MRDLDTGRSGFCINAVKRLFQRGGAHMSARIKPIAAGFSDDKAVNNLINFAKQGFGRSKCWTSGTLSGILEAYRVCIWIIPSPNEHGLSLMIALSGDIATRGSFIVLRALSLPRCAKQRFESEQSTFFVQQNKLKSWIRKSMIGEGDGRSPLCRFVVLVSLIYKIVGCLPKIFLFQFFLGRTGRGWRHNDHIVYS